MTYENPESVREVVEIYGADRELGIQTLDGGIQVARLGAYVDDFEMLCPAHDRVSGQTHKQIGYLAVALNRVGSLRHPDHTHWLSWANNA